MRRELLVDAAVALEVAAVEVYERSAEMEERPEHPVGEAVVVLLEILLLQVERGVGDVADRLDLRRGGGLRRGLAAPAEPDAARLIEGGEDRLLRAVEAGTIPVTVAMQIADSDDGNVQEALQQAYENGTLKGKRITYAQQLVEQRRRRGKAFIPSGGNGDRKIATLSLVRTYQQDVERKRYMMRKAEATRDRLTFVLHALRTLFADAELLRILRAEGLETLPRSLARRLQVAA